MQKIEGDRAMKTFRITASRVVDWEATIEAKDKGEARAIAREDLEGGVRIHGWEQVNNGADWTVEDASEIIFKTEAEGAA